MKIAINQTIVNKAQTQEDQKRMTGTYQNVDLTQKQLAEHINQGHAFCAQHKNKWRNGSNFTCAGFLAVDIDHGLSIDEAQQDELVRCYAAILYTTPRHTSENHRFRIIFELERDITTAEEMNKAFLGVIKKFGGDPRCKDPCHQFYGSKDSNPTVFGKKLPNSELDALILLGREATSQHDHSNQDGSKQRSVIRSTLLLDEDDIVKDASGNE